LATEAFDGTVKLWDIETGPLLHLNSHTDQIMNISFSPDCVYITTVSYDKRVRVWDAFTGEAKWQCEGHQKCATDAKFSPDLKYITSSSWDLTIKVWDL
ncbi:WD40 repeat-like protein, partial [Hyaloscypha bicolor E]